MSFALAGRFFTTRETQETLYWFYLFPESFAVVLLVRGQVWYLNFQKIYPTFQGDYGTLLSTQRSFHWHLFLRKRIDVNEIVLNLPHWKEINNQTQQWFLSISSTLGNEITSLSTGLFTLLKWPNCTHAMSSTNIYRWSSHSPHCLIVGSEFSAQWSGKLLWDTVTVVTKSCLTLCDPTELKLARLPCPSLSPGVCSKSYLLNQWCHLTISYSAAPFSFCLQLFLALGSFLMSQLFAWGGQSIGASASASILPMNIQGWFSLGRTGLIPCCPSYSQESSPAPKFESISFSVLSLPYGSALTSVYISIFIYSIHSHTHTHISQSPNLSLPNITPGNNA